MNDTEFTSQEIYTAEAIEAAAACLLWQAPDATEDGNGFPIGDDGNGRLHGETRFVARVVAEVPHRGGDRVRAGQLGAAGARARDRAAGRP